jgi:hypothetical protein
VVGSSLMNEMMPTSPPGVTYIVQSRNNTTELLRLKDAKELRRLLANAVHPESSVIVRKEIDSSGFEHERKIQ